MKAVIISDKDFQTELYMKLEGQVTSFLKSRGFETEIIKIGRAELKFCMGCFGCWVKKPGECIINDMMGRINRSFVNSDAVLYLSPLVFGQFSANIKNAIDRWLPNMRPFFITRPDRSTIHPARYKLNPKVIMIGYGENLSDEDEQLFSDISKKHRSNVEVLIYKNPFNNITEELNGIKLEKTGGYL